MPTITVNHQDLMALIGRQLSLSELDHKLEIVKAELGSKTKGEESLRDSEGAWIQASPEHELRIELTDTNRPDLWCAEGIARQIRAHIEGQGGDYSFYTSNEAIPAARSIEVDPRLEQIRPFVGGFIVSGSEVDEDGLLAFIEVQEVLTRNFGRKRKSVAIGIYDAGSIQFPVKYRAVSPDELRFVPLAPVATEGQELAWEEGLAMTPREILERHPTGREYASILENEELYPLLSDARGEVLSFPPVINSASLGRVEPGMKKLFVEVTGTVLDHCLLALNILAANLADRGWSIEPVLTRYPYDTARGRELRAPHDMSLSQSVPVSEFSRLLGTELGLESILERLSAYGVSAQAETDNSNGPSVKATIPSYRQDYLHQVDVIEDFAISLGYEAFEPLMPAEFTVGRIAPLTELEDQVRDRMIGLGYEEGICNILTSTEILRDRMQVGLGDADGAAPFHGGRMVAISNVMNLNYSRVRDWVLPSLMEIESRSASAVYPHRLFEVGEVAVHDPSVNMGARTVSRLGALIASDAAAFDDMQSVCYAVLGSLGLEFSVKSFAHASFIEGRAAKITVGETPVGFLGELHPGVLDAWGARMPIAALELDITALFGLLEH